MDELMGLLSAIEKDDSYSLIEVIKESQYSRIEKVSLQGRYFIRKYYFKDTYSKSEYTLLSSLDNPALPKVYDYYELQDRTVMIEEFIDGIKLSDFVGSSQGLPYLQAVELALELCSVIDYLHNRQYPVIHRDIKPENNRDTTHMGTIGYASPEQFGFSQTDIRSDIYSTGLTILFLLTGIEPGRERREDIKFNFPLPIKYIIQKSTGFAPETRYSNVREMIFDLQKARYSLQTGMTASLHQMHSIQAPPAVVSYKTKAPRKTVNTVIQLSLIPVHLITLLLTLGLIIELITLDPGFGFRDNFITIIELSSILIVMFLPPYLIGYNIFHLADRFRFFKKRKPLKIIILIIAFVFVEIFFLIFLNLFHTTDFLNSLNNKS